MVNLLGVKDALADNVDLVSLDLNMPGRGGLETLSDIRQLNASHPERPPMGVLLVSALMMVYLIYALLKPEKF